MRRSSRRFAECAKENRRLFCPTSGESGSSLMREVDGRFQVDGILSFIKGCRIFLFGEASSTGSEQVISASSLDQRSNNPSVYTKLGCFLPWIAEQYNLEFTNTVDDPSCTQGTGDISDTSSSSTCRANPSFRTSDQDRQERQCIFPFYFDGELINNCVQLGKIR